MQVSKIHLSPSEAELFSNAEIILTKNRIIQKIVALLNEVQNEMLEAKPVDQFTVGPKISKGENYLGLPYVILDYPRESAGGNLFFIRNMFWWGHFFSSTLHVSGNFREQFAAALADSFTQLADADYYIGVNADPWVHHFDDSNFVSIRKLSEEAFREILATQAHLKIAAKWPLSQWNEAPTLLLKSWKFLLNQLPRR